MNLLHFKIRDWSCKRIISKAANNLYIDVIHLSKTIKDLEENMQIIILWTNFKELFQQKLLNLLNELKSIIMQVEEMESYIQGYDDKSVHLDIYVYPPRASYVANARLLIIYRWLIFHDKNIKVNYHLKRILLIQGCLWRRSKCGNNSFPIDEEKLFSPFTKNKGTRIYEKLYQFNYQLLFSNENRYHLKEIIYLSDLETQMKITHGDTASCILPIVTPIVMIK